jgi:hypothetical protein
LNIEYLSAYKAVGPAGPEDRATLWLTENRLQTSDYRLKTTGFFGVYLLIRKRAVLRYFYRLLAVYVCLLANIWVF